MSSSGPGRPARPHVPKAAQVLADALRRRMLAQRLPVGSELPSEGELIEETGFSRGVVREALRLLEADGLISIRRGSHGGISVAHPDSRLVTQHLALLLALSDVPMRDLFAFRALLEPATAGLAAGTATAEQRARLVEMARLDAEHPVAHHVDFHLALAETIGNEFFHIALSALHELTLWHSLNEDLSEEALRAGAAAHQRIARYVAEGDAARAQHAMRAHIAGYERILADQDRVNAPVIRRTDWPNVVRSLADAQSRTPTKRGRGGDR